LLRRSLVDLAFNDLDYGVRDSILLIANETVGVIAAGNKDQVH